MRMRQSLAQIERAFTEQVEADRGDAADVQREVELRSRRRQLDRTNRAGSCRFVALVVVLAGTAVLVTVVMFRTLYLVMG